MDGVSACTRLGGRVELLVNRGHRGIDAHWHDSSELLTVTSGCVAVVAGGASYTLRSGETLLIPPGVVHATQGEATVRVVRFRAERAAERAKRIVIGRTLETAAATIEEGACRDVEDAVARLIGSLDLAAEAAPGATRRSQAALALMDARYDDRLTLESLSRSVGLSSFHFQRVFVKELGLSPHGYLSSLRVERARRALCRGDSVASVALQVGFSSQAHLTAWFRRLAGITPGAYARSVRER